MTPHAAHTLRLGRSAHSPRRSARGFTLVELLVSLVAGLVIGLAVVTLSKSVAQQFHEESRANAAQASARLSSLRLRADISRAGLMGTGNIVRDPKAAHLPGGNGAKGIPGLQQLSGVRVFTGGSLIPPSQANTLQLSVVLPSINAGCAAQTPALTPDSFAVWGNMTSGDEYFGTVDDTAPSACGGKRVVLNPTDPSLLRILRDPNGVAVPAAQAQAALSQVFAPIANQSFFARVTDNKGYYHFATTCAVPVLYNGVTATIELAGVNATLTSAQTNEKGGVGGSEEIAISPLHGVYWFIGRRVNVNLENAGSTDQSAQKYDLMRAWVNSGGVALVNEAEVVSEYAVDLKVGFTVDDPSQPDTSVNKSLTFPFSATAVAKAPWANRDLTSAVPIVPNRGSQGPHRIRSLRYRLTTRAAQTDRDEPFVVAGSDYMYRYRINNKYARVRVMTGEVALVNQARMSY
ncbi:MAG: type II secretion system protein [Myxococcales bacterium]|nr:type II secretion system protein [Myxococcales bacterium]